MGYLNGCSIGYCLPESSGTAAYEGSNKYEIKHLPLTIDRWVWRRPKVLPKGIGGWIGLSLQRPDLMVLWTAAELNVKRPLKPQ